MVNKLKPARPVKPGNILRRELEARGWTQQEFAEIIGKPVQAVNEIIAGKKSITPETAIVFSEAFGTSAELWLNLESSYRLNIVRSDGSDGTVARKAALHDAVPVKELIKKGWISAQDNIDELEAEILSFLGINKLGEIGLVAARLRVSEARTPEQVALTAWLRRAEILALGIDVKSYSAAKLQEAVAEMRHLSRMPNQIEAVRQRLSDLGVRFVVVPHLSKTYIDGAAFWLDSNSPVVAVSLRYNRVDNFWFTLMHEVAHILLHADGGSQSFVDEKMQEADVKNTCEAEANAQASEWLIPDNAFRKFHSDYGPYYSQKKVLAFADDYGIHPGIIVGRIQKATGRYDFMRRYLAKACDPAELNILNRAA